MADFHQFFERGRVGVDRTLVETATGPIRRARNDLPSVGRFVAYVLQSNTRCQTTFALWANQYKGTTFLAAPIHGDLPGWCALRVLTWVNFDYLRKKGGPASKLEFHEGLIRPLTLNLPLGKGMRHWLKRRVHTVTALWAMQ